MLKTNVLAMLFLCLGISGCSTVSISDYAEQTPLFKPQEFFDGSLLATGVVKNRAGKVTRRFTADITAYWESGVGVLEEDFIFDDGERDRRVWRLAPVGQGRFRATAGDVVGDGEARVSGNAMFLDYVLRIPIDDGTIDLTIDDRMYLVTPDRLINESVMRKFGIRVGQILLVIERVRG